MLTETPRLVHREPVGLVRLPYLRYQDRHQRPLRKRRRSQRERRTLVFSQSLTYPEQDNIKVMLAQETKG